MLNKISDYVLGGLLITVLVSSIVTAAYLILQGF